MADQRGQAQAALDALTAGGLLGAGLVSRDGLPVLMRFKRSIQEETFSAMSAAMLGAAEAALHELANPGPASALVETAEVRLYIAGIDDVHLLVAAAASAMDGSKLRSLAEPCAAQLRKILGG